MTEVAWKICNEIAYFDLIFSCHGFVPKCCTFFFNKYISYHYKLRSEGRYLDTEQQSRQLSFSLENLVLKYEQYFTKLLFGVVNRN